MPFPVEYGGQGTDYLTCMLAIEEMARSCAATAFTMSVHTGVSSMAIFLYGTEEQKNVYRNVSALFKQPWMNLSTTQNKEFNLANQFPKTRRYNGGWWIWLPISMPADF